MKILRASLLFPIFLACLGVWAVKPFPKDPVERAKALERYKKGLALYAKGQKLHRESKYDEANATYEQSMVFFQDGPKPDVANSFNSLGNAYLTEKPKIALWYYGRALAIRQADHGQNHETVASSYNKVGMACMRMEEYDRALAYFEGALRIFKRVIAKKDSGHFGAGHSHLATAYAAKKDFPKAVHHYEAALEIFVRVFSEKHPNVARAQRDLGFALIESGNKARGMELLQQAKATFTATEGAGYIETKELVEKMDKLK
ncbi:MAG: hypothetical protein CMI30_00920 [Opitutae bacterium]|jgi:tetratricopeptide (TPR) repeat protein|nr:hypothetical protein [Opitutae bacterium]|tara:strand:+ start:295 stop:1074 length:780 start_codon:yes stop_codon:yes gene_type:complete